ncbi:MAG: type II toxin-antitoxin system PemK/MazF family toxin [bacterium]|nr:type II toxin-antitoxin system PemK/MazF family toxin [bacterium]MCY3951961.1 type II toxin-antitoxin system PemK/MazF family toxin [bacterium]MCY4102165.1 type II toxin-antitoxin system PemK/MazF family toxin [bacterium]
MASIDELWSVDFGPSYPAEPAFRRPAVVVGPPDSFGREFPVAIVVPLTTARRDLSCHVEVEATPANGLAETSYAQCELVRSVNRDRLVRRLGVIDYVNGRRISDVLRMLLDH